MSNLSDLFDLTGKTAMVTGGSRGLGLQISQALGSYGANLALIARKANQLEETCTTIASDGIYVRP
ncbi:MAG: SDR family NAD(P)-dependent oxidoreductase, partial [Rhodobacter sp.]|nr:SDR family NAD(P)-dependent oxidoreductase [Rhodobacter sp.]